LIADHLHQQQMLTGNRVVATVMSNLGLELALRKRQIDLVRHLLATNLSSMNFSVGADRLAVNSPVISFFQRSALLETGWSRHCQILRILAKTGQTVNQLAAGMVRMPQILINLPVREKRPFEEMPPVTEALTRLEEEMAGSGRILLRYSGTENLVRIMIEGVDEATIQQAGKFTGPDFDASTNSTVVADSSSMECSPVCAAAGVDYLLDHSGRNLDVDRSGGTRIVLIIPSACCSITPLSVQCSSL
jgi:phosphomannomutase